MGDCSNFTSPVPEKNVQIRFHPYTLELKHPFAVAVSSRATTPVMLVEIEHDGLVGYGEAAMPPYLGESQQTAGAFLSKVELKNTPDLLTLKDTLERVDALAPGNHAAKAAVDIALHDWLGKKMGRAWYQVWNLDPAKTPVTSFTIGIDKDKDVVRQKVREAEPFEILKVKLGGNNDKEMIDTIREVSDKPLRVDVNQGWKDRTHALKIIEWLATMNVELVEQPMPKEMVGEHVWLKERSPLPIIADESVVRLSDVRNAWGVYHGVNIKLMKCTGMHEAYQMIRLARAFDMKIMLGCMTETSCAILAATQLSPLVDYADLDGALLIKNNPFEGVTVRNGKILIPKGPGIGARKI